ncbi:MAG: DUF2059 domain-containing protein [Candidatus Helarchaeota archaeon]|nr:DUF2059 domain-containing protein [Candidatus Helarchaeota archaeon]
MTDMSNKSKQDDIKKLIELSGAKNIATQSFNFIMQTYKEQDPEIYEILEKEINLEEMIDEIFTHIYNRYFTESEIEGLIRFYESSLGKKMLSLSPKMFQEAALMAQEQIQKKLEKYMD